MIVNIEINDINNDKIIISIVVKLNQYISSNY